MKLLHFLMQTGTPNNHYPIRFPGIQLPLHLENSKFGFLSKYFFCLNSIAQLWFRRFNFANRFLQACFSTILFSQHNSFRETNFHKSVFLQHLFASSFPQQSFHKSFSAFVDCGNSQIPNMTSAIMRPQHSFPQLDCGLRIQLFQKLNFHNSFFATLYNR